uniref:Uncharacterized protein n=1 Tax=Panagrolaimus sp. ES5 TaxID=591445 RepID=A0AC34FYW1_9BILA
MATKDYCLSDNADNFFDKSINDDQYSNLNLNHNYQSLNADNKHSKNVTNISRKVQNYAATKLPDFTNSNDLKAKRNLNSWKKSSNTFSPIFSNLIGESREEEHEFKTLKSANNSTLSLHISAYENLIEADKSDSNELEKEGLKSKGQYCRQQENQNKRPEVMQFKASQKLRNPNEATVRN